jgi:Helix-turn-helix domain
METVELIRQFIENGGTITRLPTVVADGAYAPGEAKPDVEQAKVGKDLSAVSADKRPKRGPKPKPDKPPKEPKQKVTPQPEVTRQLPSEKAIPRKQTVEERLTPQRSEILAYYHQTRSIAACARHWHVSDEPMRLAIRKWLEEEGLESGHTKFNWPKSEVMRRLAEGETVVQISQALNLPLQSLYSWVRRWKAELTE